ncbi:hypothetical protein [Sodaliphilus sp.]|uniref:hypothetical protein n=1 Tax=Sodaliphilus sp. TaxID=2815818 RepID=UPI00388F9F08
MIKPRELNKIINAKFSRIMKRILASAFVAFVAMIAVAQASAQELVVYTSRVTGFTCMVPANAQVQQDNYEALIIGTPDGEFVVTAIAANSDEVPEDVLAGSIKSLADNASIDLNKAVTVELENENLEGSMIIDTYENGGGAAVGAMEVPETPLCFVIAVVAGVNYVAHMDKVLHSLSWVVVDE